ncbi:hypothetical protein A9310_17715 [Gordonia sp. UCD-TK1]|nr:hypothetical protein A9310_17715 [Gordonia sp. UCD-TK1]
MLNVLTGRIVMSESQSTPPDEAAGAAWPPERQIRHLRERALLTSGVCAEALFSEGDYASNRVRNAVIVFEEWIELEFGLPSEDLTYFHYGLSGFKDVDGADELLQEIQLGASVCESVRLAWWSDSFMEAERYAEDVADSLTLYLRCREGRD